MLIPTIYLTSANLTQHVQERTHIHGHVLDLVISLEDDSFVKEVSVTSMLTDHVLLTLKYI